MQTIKFKKLHLDAKMPTRGSEGAAGWDLYTLGEPEVTEVGVAIYIFHTGISVQIPPGYFLAIYPRSSMIKHGLTLTNCVGVIDQDYRGEIIIKAIECNGSYKTYDPLLIPSGTRLVQAVCQQYEPIYWQEVEELADSKRGDGGWGSTGK